MKDSFGSTMKRGKNLDILNRGRNFYVEKSVKLQEYFFNLNCSHRRIVSGSEPFLEKCDICGTPLFKILETVDINNERKLVVVPKRKLLFVDTDGNHHSVCFKQNECLSRVEKKPMDEPMVQFIPTFEEFVEWKDDNHEMTPPEKEITRAAKKSYDKDVRPFISFWRDKEINKSNLTTFLVELKKILDSHLIYYDEYTDGYPLNNHLALENKLLSLVGIRRHDD